MKLGTGFREAAGQFLPLGVLAVALAVFVSVVPSVRSDQDVDTTRDPFAGAGATTTVAGTDSAAAPLPGGSAGAGTDATSATTAPSVSGGAPGGSAGSGGGESASPTTAPAGGGTTAQPAAGPQEDCSRQEVLGSTVGCKPGWAGGDNEGATDRGITEDKVTVVIYVPKRNEQVDSLLGAAGVRTAQDVQAALPVFEQWFNENFQLYGRELDLVFQWGPGSANDDSQQQADAIRTDEEIQAFASFIASGTNAYHDELARRGVLNFSGILPLGHAYLEERAPYTFLLIPDNDLLLDHVAEYYCKRLDGASAEHAGDPVTSAKDRKLGIIHFESDITDLGAALNQRLQATCGVQGYAVAYPADITRAAQIATSTIAQMKSEDVTTVTCICDPIAPVFFTSEATRQAWFPEWVHNGFWGTDSVTAGRLYDQTQWGNSFGPSGLTYYTPYAEQSDWQAYWSTVPEGEGDPGAAQALGTEWSSIVTLLSAMERSGPGWTSEEVARAIFEGDPIPATHNSYGGWSPQFSYGPGRPGPFSGIDDMMEIWWAPDRAGPDGDQGTLFYVDEGARRGLGQWPAGKPNVFVDDGSRQPGPDPHAQCECNDP